MKRWNTRCGSRNPAAVHVVGGGEVAAERSVASVAHRWHIGGDGKHGDLRLSRTVLLTDVVGEGDSAEWAFAVQVS